LLGLKVQDMKRKKNGGGRSVKRRTASRDKNNLLGDNRTMKISSKGQLELVLDENGIRWRNRAPVVEKGKK